MSMRRLPSLLKRFTAVAALSIVLGPLMPLNVGAASIVIPVSVSGSAYGKRFVDWSGEWWQFVLALPISENPLVDVTGEKCAVGQRGPVWFLMGSLGTDPVTRTCSIPEGTALFFPVINFVDINGSTQTADELRAEIAPCLDAVTQLLVEIDGQPVEKLSRARLKARAFDVTLPPGGFFGPGTYSPAVDDGFYVMLKPLQPGNHTIHIQAARGGCPLAPGPFSQDITYRLTVVPVSLK